MIHHNHDKDDDGSVLIVELGEPADPCLHCGAQLLGCKHNPQANKFYFCFFKNRLTGWLFCLFSCFLYSQVSFAGKILLTVVFCFEEYIDKVVFIFNFQLVGRKYH